MVTIKNIIPGACKEKSTKLCINKTINKKDNNINLVSLFFSLIFFTIILK